MPGSYGFRRRPFRPRRRQRHSASPIPSGRRRLRKFPEDVARKFQRGRPIDRVAASSLPLAQASVTSTLIMELWLQPLSTNRSTFTVYYSFYSGGVGRGTGVGRGLGVGVGLDVGVVDRALRNTPPPAVPANANPPASIASAETFPPGGINPLLTSLQLPPSLVERKTPPAAPAKM